MTLMHIVRVQAHCIIISMLLSLQVICASPLLDLDLVDLYSITYACMASFTIVHDSLCMQVMQGVKIETSIIF